VLGSDHPGLFAVGDAAWLAKLLAAASRDPGFLLKLCESQRRIEIPWSDEAGRELSRIYRNLIG